MLKKKADIIRRLEYHDDEKKSASRSKEWLCQITSFIKHLFIIKINSNFEKKQNHIHSILFEPL